MFDFNWPELMIIGVVALVIIGPEDLPDMFRQVGRFTGKLRQMSREFSRAMDQAAKETGVKDVARDLRTATSAKSLGLDAVKEAADKFEKWDPLKNTAKPTVTMPARSMVAPAAPAAAVAVDDAAEAADDLAEHGADAAAGAVAEAPAPTIHGPHTQALYDKAKLRAQVIAEQTAKLRAINEGTYVPPVEAPASEAPAAAVPAAAEPVSAEAVAEAPKPVRKRTTKPKAEAATAEDATPVAEAVKALRARAEKEAAKEAAAKAEAEAAPKARKTRKKAGEETA